MAESWRTHLGRVDRIKTAKNEYNIWQENAHVKVHTPYPYYFMTPLSDIHLGAQGTDYDALGKYVDTIKRLGIGTVLVGDIVDFFNPKKIPDGMLGDILTPDQQMVMARSFIDEIAPNCVAIVGGNHDGFISGFDLYRYIAEDKKIPLMAAGGVLTLGVNDQEYRIGLYHKIGKYNSSLNVTHAGLQAHRMAHDDLDAVVTGHTHIGGLTETVMKDRVVHVTQLGTFKTVDPWGNNEGFMPRTQVFFPTMAFGAKEHTIEELRDIGFAETIISLFQESKKKEAQAALGLAAMLNRSLDDWKGVDPD